LIAFAAISILADCSHFFDSFLTSPPALALRTVVAVAAFDFAGDTAATPGLFRGPFFLEYFACHDFTS
jgi:hypothetical protein